MTDGQALFYWMGIVLAGLLVGAFVGLLVSQMLNEDGSGEGSVAAGMTVFGPCALVSGYFFRQWTK